MNIDKILEAYSPVLWIVLALALLAVVRTLSSSRKWGYGTSGMAAVVVIIVILLLLGYI